MGMSAPRGLAESRAHEMSPQGVHVAHFIIDRAIGHVSQPVSANRPNNLLDPDAIAQTLRLLAE
jgi:hypothetical protein